MSNGFGSQVIFSTGGITSTAVTGSILKFTHAKQSEMKEATDGYGNYLGVFFPKQKRVATLQAVFNQSGSLAVLQAPGTTGTIVNPWSGDVSGSYGVTKASLNADSDGFVTIDVEMTQWITSAGTLP